jgi:hypothetical protein
LTSLTGVQAILHDVQRVEGKKETPPHHNVCAKSRKTIKEY